MMRRSSAAECVWFVCAKDERVEEATSPKGCTAPDPCSVQIKS